MESISEKKIEMGRGLTPVAADRAGDIERYPTTDVIFGEVIEGQGPNYRSVGWLGTAVLMMKTQIGLGVLSIPLVFGTVGLVPGVICLLAISAITTWSDYMVGVFKRNHPEVYGIDDVGKIIFGPIGHWIFSVGFVLYMIFIVGSAILSVSIALNAISLHGTCTAVFVAVATVVGFCLGSVRTLSKVSWFAWVGLTSILTAIAVGVQNRPSAAPQTGPWSSDYHITMSPKFPSAASAMSSLVFAFAGTPAFFNIATEMKDPRYYNRALFLCQTVVTLTYLIIGIVVYYYCGSYVSSPALGSAGVLMKRVCYGLALPGLLVTTILYVHLPAKYVFIRLLRGSRHLVSNSPVHWSIWLCCTSSAAITAYIIASAIPVFNDLVSLIGALLGTLMSFIPFPFMWLYDNRQPETKGSLVKWRLMCCWCIFVFVSGTFLLVAGTYGSVVDIINSYHKSGGSAAWSCIDNSV